MVMPLTRGDVGCYDFSRMTFTFTMFDGSRVINCAVSTAAMDDMERRSDVPPREREEQFLDCVIVSKTVPRASRLKALSRLEIRIYCCCQKISFAEIRVAYISDRPRSRCLCIRGRERQRQYYAAILQLWPNRQSPLRSAILASLQNVSDVDIDDCIKHCAEFDLCACSAKKFYVRLIKR
jgi:hypothetical protein